MKKLHFFLSMTFVFLLFSGISQTTIWEEDFNSYPDGTTIGSGTPAKWTIDVSACNFVDIDDYFEVRTNRMVGTDLEGEALWMSENIDISSFANISIEIELSEAGLMDETDYIQLYYILDNGPETLFETNGSLSDDFISAIASQSGLNGNNLEILIKVNNNSSSKNHRIENIVIVGGLFNGDCSNAAIITEVTDYPFSTLNATASGMHPGCGGGQDPIDLWFVYTPTSDGTASVDLCGSNYDTRVAVWDGCSGSVLLCNDDDDYCGNGSLQSFITGEVTANTSYYIQVGGYNSNTGDGFLTISLEPTPANNNCATAIPIGEVTDLPFSTNGASSSGKNPDCGGNQAPIDLWYSYTPTQSGIVSIDLCGSEFNTRLAVWDDCNAVESLMCNVNDNYCGWFSQTSYLTGEVVANETYYIQVGGNNTATGNGDLTLTMVPYPTNDDCSNAIPIGEVTDLAYTTIGATAGGDNPNCGGNQDPVDIWYTYTATQNGIINIDLCGSQYDTRLAIWEGCGVNLIECNDNDNYCGWFSETSFVTTAVTANSTYYIQVGGADGAVGVGDITLSFFPDNTNDDCANAIAIGEVTDLAFTTIGATAGGDNPGCGTQSPVDIWFAYTPTMTGVASIDLCGSDFNTRLAVWSECSGIVLACNDNDDYCGWFSQTSYLTVDVIANQTYYIQVGGNNNTATGNGDLTVAIYPYPVNDDCANALPIGEVTDLPFTTESATSGGDNPGCGDTNPVDIWYAYTASGDGLAMFDLCGSNFDTQIAIWDACGGFVLQCNNDDNFCGWFSDQSYVEHTVTAGTTYYIQVGGNNGEVGLGDLTIYLEAPSNTNIWTGIVSDDWSEANNWQSGYLPTSAIDVTIPSSPAGGYYPEANNGLGAECNDMVIQPGARLYVPTNNTLSVNGNLGNSGGTNGLVIKANNGGSGSLLHANAGVNARVEQYLVSEQWHLVSPPVSNAQIGTYMDVWLKKYDEENDEWIYLVEPVTMALNASQGYSAWTSDALLGTTTVNFSGLLNNGDFSVSLSYQSSTANIGWNLIGNPYPSALQWNNVWSKSNVGEWACIHNNGNDECYNAATGIGWPNAGSMANGIIPPTQGFWVKAVLNPASVTIPQSERLHSNQSFYKGSSSTIENSIRLRVDGNDDFDAILVQFIDGATDGFDTKFDLDKRWGYEESPNIYTMTGDNELFSVNALPIIDSKRILPVGFETGISGNFTIEATEFEGFYGDYEVVLEDILTGVFTTLNENVTYSYSAGADDEAHRFNLHFLKSSAGIETMTTEVIRIYANDNRVYIQSPEDIIEEVVIVDLMGREILRDRGDNQHMLSLPVYHNSGYYIVQVRTAKNISTQKVFIK